MKHPLSTDDCWRIMRAMRHQPPANAYEGSRRLLFASAMKQSEQLFRLSDVAGYETKPILLYYGLNQAARAIVAAAARPGEPWELKGHGLTSPNLAAASSLGEVTVLDQGQGKSFQMLAQYTDSPTLAAKVPVRDLWASLPEGLEVPLQGSLNLCSAVRLHASASVADVLPQDSTISLFGLPAHHEDDRRSVQAVRQLLDERYPTLQFLEPRSSDGHVSLLFNAFAHRGILRLRISPGAVSAPSGYNILQCGPQIYKTEQPVSVWIIPTLGGNTEPLSPIVTWWAVLYVLSMLARYQPSSWTKMLDIDRSPDAPAVEYLLDEAHRVCVNLIVDVFGSVKLTHFWQDDQDE